MHTIRLMTAGLAVAATTAALVAGPTHADKPGNGASTGTGQIFMVNPVQSSGDQSLTDSKDANTPELAAQYTTAQLRNLDGTGTLSGQVGRRPDHDRHPGVQRRRTRSSTPVTRTSSSRSWATSG